jgi:drug/metabolite transporter (DMT)-like permease
LPAQNHVQYCPTQAYAREISPHYEYIAKDVQPFSAAFTRFVMASAMLLLLTWRVEGRLPGIKRRHIIPIILLGMTGVVGYNVFFFNGLQTVSAGRASVIVATNPIFITLLAALFFKEKLSPIRAGGIQEAAPAQFSPGPWAGENSSSLAVC